MDDDEEANIKLITMKSRKMMMRWMVVIVTSMTSRAYRRRVFACQAGLVSVLSLHSLA